LQLILSKDSDSVSVLSVREILKIFLFFLQWMFQKIPELTGRGGDNAFPYKNTANRRWRISVTKVKLCVSKTTSFKFRYGIFSPTFS